MYAAYACVTDGKTPDDILEKIGTIAMRLSELGYTARLNGNKPATNYVSRNSIEREIYLPWNKFEAEQGGEKLESKFCKVTDAAIDLMEEHYTPRNGKDWATISLGVKKIISRDAHMILGNDLRSPVKFLITWTMDGAEKKQDLTPKAWFCGPVISLAVASRIPVFNLKNPNTADRLNQFLEM